ncbi:sulfatase [Nonomuraea longispora]|uniref:Sulfatase n=1 Tax=Nonomuraea longispora TaxID=1848320 RepID=A0A4R4N6T0_9ACTN|nr:sulfatase-like hydrolase/transferase [Nonomuraea longispora]TDC02052.1 sulfatase [Nonomuraea longispora]
MPPAPPNVVLIVADDLGPGDLGVLGSRAVRTPHLDALARHGRRFTAAYAAAATDTPSRAGLLTGRYGARLGLPHSLGRGADAGLGPGAVTIASALRAAGYATACVGQWRLGDRPQDHPLRHGFGRFHGTMYGTDVSPLPLVEGHEVVKDDFDVSGGIAHFTAKAREFVAERREQPFFLYLSYLDPHVPYRPDPAFAGRSAAGAYGDVVECLDHHVGALLGELDRNGLRGSTLVIFTSDNGPRYEGATQRRRGRKPEVYDGGVRVPFLIRGPGRVRPGADHEPMSLVDVPATLAALCSAPMRDLDGYDLSPRLAGHDAGRPPVYLFFGPHLNAARHGRWKLHVRFSSDRTAYMPQLFDVAADPGETCDVSSRHADVAERMRTGLEEFARTVEAS